MSSGKLIEELSPGDLVILKGRRQRDKKNPGIIMKVLEADGLDFLESFSYVQFKYLVYIDGETRYVTEGHIERVLSSTDEIDKKNA